MVNQLLKNLKNSSFNLSFGFRSSLEDIIKNPTTKFVKWLLQGFVGKLRDKKNF
jgi:hypothetical protein